eukprot:gnl/Chilomastix_caulleri/6630.p2 GENE.gnl/Chilomastix_caulleri/6630~~gnl/Chilomastix_caulleri/6630.p2  ORF type:complete len:52 (+),score=0.75 gnl/Chilomastix_caulleri/6630:203-358(+)
MHTRHRLYRKRGIHKESEGNYKVTFTPKGASSGFDVKFVIATSGPRKRQMR